MSCEARKRESQLREAAEVIIADRCDDDLRRAQQLRLALWLAIDRLLEAEGHGRKRGRREGDCCFQPWDVEALRSLLVGVVLSEGLRGG